MKHIDSSLLSSGVNKRINKSMSPVHVVTWKHMIRWGSTENKLLGMDRDVYCVWYGLGD